MVLVLSFVIVGAYFFSRCGGEGDEGVKLYSLPPPLGLSCPATARQLFREMRCFCRVH